MTLLCVQHNVSEAQYITNVYCVQLLDQLIAGRKAGNIPNKSEYSNDFVSESRVVGYLQTVLKWKIKIVITKVKTIPFITLSTFLKLVLWLIDFICDWPETVKCKLKKERIITKILTFNLIFFLQSAIFRNKNLFNSPIFTSCSILLHSFRPIREQESAIEMITCDL
jgi:hypothetical protein